MVMSGPLRRRLAIRIGPSGWVPIEGGQLASVDLGLQSRTGEPRRKRNQVKKEEEELVSVGYG